MKNSKPKLVMNRDINLVKHCVGHALECEPASVVGIEGMGISIIYQNVVKRLKDKVPLVKIDAQNPNELRKFLKAIMSIKGQVALLINISTKSDESWFIERLNSERENKGTSFVPIVFADFENVYQSFLDQNKLLFRSLKVLKPIILADTRKLVADFNRRFKFSPTDRQVKNIYELSGGHVGLVKSIYLYQKENPDKTVRLDDAVKTPRVNFRITNIVENLESEFVENMLRISSKYDTLYKTLSIKKGGKFFSPIFEDYMRDRYDQSPDRLDLSLSSSESKLVRFLQKNQNALSDRDQIAKVIWENDWENQYSDWAIDQAVSRLRRKLKKANSEYEIITKKGRGFILRKK